MSRPKSDLRHFPAHLAGLELVVDRETKRGSDELGARVTRRCLELGPHMNIVQLPGMGDAVKTL